LIRKFVFALFCLLPVTLCFADEVHPVVSSEIKLSPKTKLSGMSQTYVINSQQELNEVLKKIYGVIGDDPIVLTVHGQNERIKAMLEKSLKPKAVEEVEDNAYKVDLRFIPWWNRIHRGRILWTVVKTGAAYASWIHFGPDGLDPSVKQGAFVFSTAVLALFSTPFPRELARIYRTKAGKYMEKVASWKLPDRLAGVSNGEKVKFIIQDAPFTMGVSFAINFGFISILNDMSFVDSVQDVNFWGKVVGLAAFSTFVTRSWKFALHHWTHLPPDERPMNFYTIDKVSMPIEGAILVARPFLLVGELSAVAFLTTLGVSGYYLLFKGDDLFRSWNDRVQQKQWQSVPACRYIFR